MAPPRVAEYVKKAFQGTPVTVEVIADRKVFEKEYPLFAAVSFWTLNKGGRLREMISN